MFRLMGGVLGHTVAVGLFVVVPTMVAGNVLMQFFGPRIGYPQWANNTTFMINTAEFVNLRKHRMSSEIDKKFDKIHLSDQKKIAEASLKLTDDEVAKCVEAAYYLNTV